MNFVLGFVVLVILIAAQNEPITSKTIYAIQDGALCGQTGLQAHVGLAFFVLPCVELYPRQLHLLAVPQHGEIRTVG